MGNNQNTLELNGNIYDARTGQILGSDKKEKKQESKAAKPAKHGNGAVDGFARKRHISHRNHAKTPAHVVHAKRSKSKTLVRSAVKKPSKTEGQIKHIDPQKPPAQEPKSLGVDTDRLRRAGVIRTSKLVSRFGAEKQKPDKKIAHLPVRAAPDVRRVTSSVSLPIQETTTAVEEPDLPLNTLDLALKNANSHEQAEIKKPSLRHRAAKRLRISPKTLNVSVGLLAALVIGSYLAYNHIPNLAVQLAATRAGVNARLPGYQPSGFSLNGPVQYGAGQITLQYNSNSDDRSFKVIQKKSDWNSNALLDNFVTASEKPYQTFQDNGKTIYIYDGSNATWVSGGIWYQVEGQSSLNSDQLLRIAGSL